MGRLTKGPQSKWSRRLWVPRPRENILTNTEFPNGLAGLNNTAGLVTAVSNLTWVNGMTAGIAIGHDGTSTQIACKNGTAPNGTTYNVSLFVRMDDGLAPAFGSTDVYSPSNDFSLCISNSAINPMLNLVESIGGGIYRVSVSSSTGASPLMGVFKLNTNSTRTFVVSGYMQNLGATVLRYQRDVSNVHDQYNG